MSYVGIDLGTTNSVICSYDGTDVHLYKSTDQKDVTPSAIFIDKRGKKYFGSRAYDSAARSPDNAAILFKRLVGTSTPLTLAAVNVVLTPEECSAEILRLLYGYLPAKIRNDDDTGVVITVPAAFNQMQKAATMAAAEAADLGRVALMQEPVAAVMSAMRTRKTDGVFLVYDLGGGTLDIAIAESTARRVSLLSHGGIAMCGGRDFDRMLVDSVVVPWLLDHFELPAGLASDPQFKPLLRMVTWAAEKAKIDLSQQNEAAISLPDTDLRVRDLGGQEIYVDIELDRTRLDKLIAPQIAASVDNARETLSKAALRPQDLECIVFVGGPTHYKPLRDKVCTELGLAPSTDVNPMTAVAEGAAVFAESVDWSSRSRGRKSARGSLSVGDSASTAFNFVSRTPDSKARIVAAVPEAVPAGGAFQIDSLDSGWSSGRMVLGNGATVEVILGRPGENTFKIFVFDAQGAPLSLPNDKIVITRTAATIDAIPASHSLFVEALERLGGRSVPDFLVRSGDRLPAKGTRKYKAATSLRAGGTGALTIKLWEGEILDPVQDNRPIGALRINGTDFDDGVIGAGDDLICEFEVLDSGNIRLEVSVPSIGASFHGGRNFYSRQEGQVDYTRASQLIHEQALQMLQRLAEIEFQIQDPRIAEARKKLQAAADWRFHDSDPEAAKMAMDWIQEAKRFLALARRHHLPRVRQIDLEKVTNFFAQEVRQYARPTEITSFDALAKTAQRAIERESGDFESYLEDLRGRNFAILWRQDWFVIDRFKWLAQSAHNFPDETEHAEWISQGTEALKANDVDKLRAVVSHLDQRRFGSPTDDDLLSAVNIVRA
jgi:molecular chaperone DnaK